MDDYLAKVPIFAGLEPAALEILLKRAEPSKAAAGQVIVREGETSARFFLVKSGSVRVVKRHGASDEVTLANLGVREFFGEMCILETLPRAATVVAHEDSELISLPSTAFYHLYQAKPAQYAILLLNIARDLSRRLRRIDEVYAARV